MIKTIIAISNHGMMLGGGEHSFLDLLSHLPPEWHVLAALPEEAELAQRLKEKGIQTHIIPLPSLRPWLAPAIFASLRSCYGMCRKIQPSLIYANGSRAAFYGGLIGRILSLPVIWHCRIAEADKYLDFILPRLSSRIIVNSKATLARFGSRFQTKVELVYNGVNVGWVRLKPVKKPDLIQRNWKTILVVARVSRWKRHDIVVSAFEQVAASDPDAHLVCVGARDQLDLGWWRNLQQRTNQSKFSNRIHWIGQVDDVRPWYGAAHALVLASENEPFGRVLVEAMALGLPVVATRGGGVSEIVRHGKDGLLVSSGNADEIVRALRKILKDEPLRRRLAESARKRAELFNLDKHVEKMVGIFGETIKYES